MNRYDFKTLLETEKELKKEFDKLQKIQNKIKTRIQKLSGDRKLKGDEIVGWLGELFCSILMSGKIITEDNLEYDVVTQNMRISVKTRKGNKDGWNRTSHISSKAINESSPTHLMFIQLDDDFSVQRIWLYDWDEKLVERFKLVNEKKPKLEDEKSENMKTTVQQINTGVFYFKVNPKKDDSKLIYTKEND